jgi:hypothetical protein
MAPGMRLKENIKMVLFFPYTTGNKQTVLSIDIVMFFQAAPEN